MLLVLALVPTVGMGLFAAGAARSSAEVAGEVGEVARDAAELVDAVELWFALGNEQLPTQAVLRIEDFGISVQEASSLIGFDLEQRYVTARLDTDAAVAALAPSLVEEYPELGSVAGELVRIRGAADGPAPDAVDVYQSTLDLTILAERVALEELDELVNRNRRVDPRSAAALQSFSTVLGVFETSQSELLEVSEVMFSSGDPQRVLTLAFESAEHQREVTRLERHGDADLHAAWAAIEAMPEVQRFGDSVASILRDPAWLTAGPADRIAQLYADGFARGDAFAALTRRAGEAGVDAAREAEERAGTESRRTVGISLGLGALAIGFAVATSWSISRPLRRLASRAALLSEGELDDASGGGGAAGASGPREVRTVARALDEAADNLRRVEEQAKALASGDLDHAVLGGAVPGVLGESVQASVEQLSRSIREQDALRERLAEQAHHDALTGLLNRAGFLTAVDAALERARRDGTQVALLFIDLDGFKRANDSHGHKFGDDVLRVTASRIMGAARGGDVVARLGGDEFVVIAEAMGVEAALRLGERLAAIVSEPIELDGRSARVGASIGVALSSEVHRRAADLLADADQAVYRAKRSGRGRVELCNDELRREVAERNQIEVALRGAIRDGELELHYQPVVDTASRRLRGFEALVRWRRPGYGLVPPISFIPVAEASDLVVDLGRWVLGEATAQLARWSSEADLADIHVSVNVSGRHLLNRAVVDDVREALDRSGVEPHRLVVEITETVILADLDVAVQHLNALRALGVRIALDDFGTGYTSIGQLGRLPVDILKIDRAFISELDTEQDRSIVELMVEVAHTLGLGLVAEGVEDADQLGVLRELTCDDVQGYLISRPLEAGAARSWATGGDEPASAAQGTDHTALGAGVV